MLGRLGLVLGLLVRPVVGRARKVVGLGGVDLALELVLLVEVGVLVAGSVDVVDVEPVLLADLALRTAQVHRGAQAVHFGEDLGHRFALVGLQVQGVLGAEDRGVGFGAQDFGILGNVFLVFFFWFFFFFEELLADYFVQF